MAVHRLVLRGSQREIGHSLGAEAANFPSIDPPDDPALNRARRRWVERNWPEHYARMEGVADAMGADLLDDRVSVVDIVAVPFRIGCSVLWCPPGRSADGRARLARNFDFRTGSALEVAGVESDVPQPPMFGQPYVIESYPIDGVASVVIVACDFSGCFEGINEAGVAVAVLADDETATLRPAFQPQAGLHESQVPRFILDQCRDVDDAIEALRCAKQYDNMFSCHYVIADRHGNACVWERDTHNAEHVVRAIDAPMCVTNYLLHRHESVTALPDDDPNRRDASPFAANMYERARSLERSAQRPSLSQGELEAALDAVAVPTAVVGARTLWRSIFELEARSMTTEFYLGDRSDGGVRRSDPVTASVHPEHAVA